MKNETRTLLAKSVSRFFGEVFQGLASRVIVIIGTLLIATMFTGAVLWLTDWPLVLSPSGGLVVLGVMLFFWSDL